MLKPLSIENFARRIRLQAPPSFMTNSSGCVAYNGLTVTSSCTPFAPEAHTIRDPTDNVTAYAKIRMGYTSRLDVTFVAFDPNPEDRVTLFVLEEPGIPENMQVGRVQCLERPADTEVMPTRVQSLLADGACLESCDTSGGSTDEQDSNQVPRCECLPSAASGQFCPTDLQCNRAKMRLQWQPKVHNAGKTYKVCVVARDNSDLCHGVSPTATVQGWYGEKQCVLIDVIAADFVWSGSWIPDMIQRPTPFPMYIGCTLTFNVEATEKTSGANYGLAIFRAEAPHELEAEAEMLHTTLTPVGTGVATVLAAPVLGSEGSTFTMCFTAGDIYRGITFPGMCSQEVGNVTNKACAHDTDCPGGTCIPACVTVAVQRCRYCVGDGDPLRTLMKDYFVDTNWLRLWALNNEAHSQLGTECPPGLDCQQDVGPLVAIDNPHLVLGTPSGTGKRILWAGMLYTSDVEQPFQDLACLFRTSLHSIAAANPDMDVTAPGATSQANQPVCIVACSRESRDQDCSLPVLPP